MVAVEEAIQRLMVTAQWSYRWQAVQAWVTGRSVELASTTVRVVYSYLSAILRSAVEDRLIPALPCNRITLPKIQPTRVEPMPTELIELLASGMPDRYGALVTLGIGTGVRQGESFGLTVDRIDFLRRTLTVDRQLVTMSGAGPYLALPKTQASNRVNPTPPGRRRRVGGSPGCVSSRCRRVRLHDRGWLADSTDVVLLRGWATRREGSAQGVGRAAGQGSEDRTAAGETPSSERAPETITFHDLRHYYASLLIYHGESVKTVQARIGHASASETLDTYSHLWPDSDDRTREAVDAVLGKSAIAVAQ